MGDRQFHQQTSYRLTAHASDKPLLVLIHGVGLNQDMWLPWLPILETDFSVLTFDLLGHGQSCNPDGKRVTMDFTDQLHELVTHVGVDQFALVGFSLGALIALSFAAGNSERLTHLALLHSVYQRTDEQRQAVRERYRITREQGTMATVEIAIKRWFSERYSVTHQAQMNQLRAIFASHHGDGYLKAYAVFCNAETEMQQDTLAHIHCPTLVITGDEDGGSTPAMSEALARDLPNAKLLINSGQHHMAPTEFADIMSNQVRSFLI